MATAAEGVASCCRSVPRAWWMKTPSNSFTHSSSLREVSPRPSPVPCSPLLLKPPLHPVAVLQRVGVPLYGGDPRLHLCAPPTTFLGAWGCLYPIGRGTPAQDTGGPPVWLPGLGTSLPGGPKTPRPVPLLPQMPPPTHTSSSMPSMLTGTGPSALR